MNVLSLFDGIACAKVALERSGHKIDKYFASEIDKYAIKVAINNHPDIVQIGDVTKVSYRDGILYTEKGIFEVGKIDFLCGGFPCQAFSLAGKQLNFDDPRGKLFFELVRIKNEIQKENPDVVFLFENVRMNKQYRNVIDELIGVLPIEIDSALVSAQKRKRNYWTNIENIVQPEDKGLLLKDILQSDTDQKYVLKNGWLKWWETNHEFQLAKQYSSINPEKALTLTARQYASWNGNFILNEKQIEFAKNKHKSCVNKNGYKRGNMKFPNDIDKKSKSLTAVQIKGAREVTHIKDWNGIRMLTPIEEERLMGLPDNYSSCISDSQRYKCLGNGWQVDTITHILSFLKKESL